MKNITIPITKYVNKLVKAWEKHGKIIICVDYDDTLVGYDTNDKELCNEVCKTVSKAQTLGAKIILWSCRKPIDIMENLIELHKIYRIEFDDLNPIEPFKENYSHKPYCNIMLDDKCGLDQALAILKETIKIYESRTTTESDESSGNDREHDVQ